jgi:4-hydroxyproline epimerase
VRVDVEGWGVIHGDLAWGGNWFFLTEEHGQRIEWANVERLTDVAWRIRQALAAQGIRGTDGGEIDHIELFGPPQAPDADSKNFVLCPGKAYDRSPCGTGTSAKLACLMAAGKLQPGEIWRQEGIVGSVFETSGQWDGERVLPTVCGRAFVTAEAELILEAEDPYRWGIEG